MIVPWKYGEYFNMDLNAQEFTQRMLFMEYMEECEQLAYHKKYVSLTEMFIRDQMELERREEYETCQLYMDTFIRFKSEFKDFG